MDEEQKEYYRDINNCRFELLEARKCFVKGTTYDQYENLIRGLLIMKLCCPEEIVPQVDATINEAQMRQFYNIFYSIGVMQ